ncbi:MAG TPA: CHASE4 domain-containing protein [Acidobacteriota bacterium]|nr:CHASE4 domain-containing protein [Acidobacteriota bacterium]
MNTQARLVALLCLVVAVFALSVGLLRRFQARETADYIERVAIERNALNDRLLELTGRALRDFANDYSVWGEMFQFVDTADRAWAKVNIDSSLNTFNAHAAWVLGEDGKLIYGAVRDLDPALAQPPFSPLDLLPYLRRARFGHFYLRIPAGVLEIRTAPIHPSEDLERKGTAHGWFLVARWWDNEHQHNLQRFLESEVRIDPADSTPPALGADVILTQRPLTDWTGRPVATLRTLYRVRGAEAVQVSNDYELFLFLGFGGIVIVAAVIGVSRWIVRPLRQLEQSLAADSPAPLGPLALQPDIFGRLATLVAGSFEHRQELEREIEERRRAETALRQSREELRQSAELKARLARDLHDGVIQSIYAAGLGLEGVRASVRNEPAAAERRLDATLASLNQTIREVRSFIQGMEPDASDRPEFTQVLRSLVSTLQALHAVQFELQLGVEPAALSAREEVHALQIVRECVSNALRHGEARRIIIALSTEASGPVLLIRDDGRGFDPASAPRGSGLSNIAARAADIGATFTLHSLRGKGTDIILRFAQRNPTP